MESLGLKRKKPIPFDFVLEAIDSLNPYTKPMFGCTAVYVDTKIVFILRDKRQPTADNGVWLATTQEHHASLHKEFPSMRSIQVFGPGVTGWQILPAEADDFEEAVFKACDLVKAGDQRIGKIPNIKKKKTAKRKK